MRWRVLLALVGMWVLGCTSRASPASHADAGSGPPPAPPPSADPPPVPGTWLGPATPETSGGTCAARTERLPGSPLSLASGPVPCGGGFCVESAPWTSVGRPLLSLGAAGGDVWALDLDADLIVRRTATGWASECLPAGAAKLLDLHAAGPKDAWAAGEAGYLAHFDGTGWTRTAADTPSDVTSISGDARQAFAATKDGVILRFDGTGWTDTYRSSGTRWPVPYVVSAAAGVALAVGNGELLAWTDAGWRALPHDGWTPEAVWVAPTGEAWAGGSAVDAVSGLTSPRLYAYAGGALTPVALPASANQAAPYLGVDWIRALSGGEVWVELRRAFNFYPDVVRAGGSLPALLPGVSSGAAVALLGPGDALVSLAGFGFDGYGGGAWLPQAALYRWAAPVPVAGPPPPVEVDFTAPSFRGVTGTAPDDLWVFGQGAAGTVLWRRDASGWRATTTGGASLLAASASGPGNAWFVGRDADGPMALVWNGSVLARRALPAGQWAGAPEAVATVAPDATWIVHDGEVKRWDGTGWTVMAGLPGAPARIWAASRDEAFAIGSDRVQVGTATPATFRLTGRILRLAGGTTTTLDLPDLAPLAIWGSSSTDVWVSAQPSAACSEERICPTPPATVAPRLLHWDGTGWTDGPALPLVALAGTGPGDVWGIDGNYAGSTLHHFDGHAWSDVTAVPVSAAPVSLVALPCGELWGTSLTSRLVHRRCQGP